MLLLRVIRLRYLLRFTGVDITFVIGYLLKARNTTSQRERSLRTKKKRLRFLNAQLFRFFLDDTCFETSKSKNKGKKKGGGVVRFDRSVWKNGKMGYSTGGMIIDRQAGSRRLCGSARRATASL